MDNIDCLIQHSVLYVSIFDKKYRKQVKKCYKTKISKRKQNCFSPKKVEAGILQREKLRFTVKLSKMNMKKWPFIL